MTEQHTAVAVPVSRPGAPNARRVGFWVLVVLATALLVTSLAIGVLTTRSFVDASPTMESTISQGDVLRVTTGVAGLRRGDVVVMDAPARASAPGSIVVKRVIGLPGDHVACCNARGRVTVNSRQLDEAYLSRGDRPSTVSFSVTVRSGKIFVLGDHRRISADSRVWGPVPQSGVVGRVLLVQHGSSVTVLRTPPTFLAGGLAPADTRPDFYVRLGIAAAASVAALVILAIIGITSLVIRGRRARRARSQAPSALPEHAA
jgi:signal peptidase I